MVGPRFAGVCMVLLALSGCTTEKDAGPPKPSPQQSPAPHGGTPDQPVVLAAEQSLLEWTPVPGAVEDTVTTNGPWTLTVDTARQGYQLDGPGQSLGNGEADARITNALLDSGWAVVVRQHRARNQPDTAEVTDLAK